MESSPETTALIILAAGASRRMGQPKQLLRWQGTTMLQRIIREGKQAGLSPVVVVTGARRAAVEPAAEAEQAHIAYNPEWESGMGSSVVTGLNQLLYLLPEVDAAAFALTDQPYVGQELLQAMLQRLQQSAAPGIAARYQGSLGVPAIFRKALFSELLSLDGQKGAKPVLLRHQKELLAYPFPEGKTDLDTPEDWAQFCG